MLQACSSYSEKEIKEVDEITYAVMYTYNLAHIYFCPKLGGKLNYFNPKMFWLISYML